MNKIPIIMMVSLLLCSPISSTSSSTSSFTPRRRLLQIGLLRVGGTVPYEEGAGLLGRNGHGARVVNGVAIAGRPPVAGYHGQDCTPDTGDYPEQCTLDKTKAIQHPILEPSHGIIGCVHNFDCCACRQMFCSPDCGEVNCNGDSSCFGVKDIVMHGDAMGADLLCNGDLSCMGTKLVGDNIRTLGCTGDGSCAYSSFNVTCVASGCPFTCLGDNSCEAHPTDPARKARYDIRNSAGLMCAHDACRYATYNLLPNVGGAIVCGGEMGCVEAIITTENVEALICGGQRGCQNANILITNPQQGWSLTCTGFNGCEGLNLEIVVTDPAITYFREISCAAMMSCRGMKVTITKVLPPGSTGSSNLVIGELGCNAAEACRNAVFDLGPGITFGSCGCAPLSTLACDGTLGIDSCLQGLDKLECVGGNSCEGMTETLRNPANYFEMICGDAGSCRNFHLDILVDGTTDTQHFKGITCGAGNSCEGLIVNVINTGANAIDSGMVKCAASDACLNAKFNTENADFSSLECGAATSCEGCESTVDGTCSICGTNEQCPVPTIM